MASWSASDQANAGSGFVNHHSPLSPKEWTCKLCHTTSGTNARGQARNLCSLCKANRAFADPSVPPSVAQALSASQLGPSFPSAAAVSPAPVWPTAAPAANRNRPSEWTPLPINQFGSQQAHNDELTQLQQQQHQQLLATQHPQQPNHTNMNPINCQLQSLIHDH